MSSPALDDYLRDRINLINEDRALRTDCDITKHISSEELRADRAVRAIRTKEAETIWGVEHDDVPHPFPGTEFLTGKKIIMKSRLFNILRMMPKGALLHVHQYATVEASFLLKLALQQPAMHIRVPNVIDSSTIAVTLPDIRPIPQEQYTHSCEITDAAYVPNTWVEMRTAREAFDPSLGGPEGFDKWIVSTFVINPSEAYGSHNTPNKIWQKFQSTFAVTDPIIRYMPIQKAYLREFIMSSIADGISYIESRYNFTVDYFVAEDGKTNLPIRDLFLLLESLVKEIQVELGQQGREDEFVGFKIIYTVSRTISCEQLDFELKRCVEFKREFPHLIAGFDLVGHEDTNKPLIYYAESLIRFIERQKQEHVEIPFLFHAGETLGDGTMADMNLYDAILLGTKRIGHGFSLVKHPRLMAMCHEQKIAVEVCPISNEILRLTSSMATHPLPALINQGVPVVLASDDPAMFSNMGLSFDFYQVLVASEVTGLIALGQIARDSITYSRLEEEEKERALRAWERRWGAFVEAVSLYCDMFV
ncbi:Metallo-dependent hydrolase [Imleria badia]|nr:Metallo-dependent hydrolase [Imleria badia]